MPGGLNEPALVDGEKGPERPGDEGIPKLGIRQTLEVGEITFALDAVLAEAGVDFRSSTPAWPPPRTAAGWSGSATATWFRPAASSTS
ncbi:hypothetical protein ACFQ3Z_21665 [Streptomyces nogalater]